MLIWFSWSCVFKKRTKKGIKTGWAEWCFDWLSYRWCNWNWISIRIIWLHRIHLCAFPGRYKNIHSSKSASVVESRRHDFTRSIQSGADSENFGRTQRHHHALYSRNPHAWFRRCGWYCYFDWDRILGWRTSPSRQSGSHSHGCQEVNRAMWHYHLFLFFDSFVLRLWIFHPTSKKLSSAPSLVRFWAMPIITFMDANAVAPSQEIPWSAQSMAESWVHYSSQVFKKNHKRKSRNDWRFDQK